MTYVKVDDHFTEHPKVLEIGPMAECLWLRGLCYAGRNRTDGRVPAGIVRRMGDMDGEATAARLVEVGLWEAEAGGWRMHDYGDWQRSREEIDEISAKRTEAGRRGGKQRASKLLELSLANVKQNSSKRLAYTDTDTDTDTETGDSPPLPPSLPAAPAEPTMKPVRAVPKPKAIQTPIDPAWEPSVAALQWTVEKGWPAAWIVAETEKMRDHFVGTGGKKADWEATWRNWLRRASEAMPLNRGSPNGRQRGGVPTETRLQRAAALERQGL